MTATDLPLEQVISRAYARAVPAAKVVRLVRSWSERHTELQAARFQSTLCDALLRILYQPPVPALKIAYVTQLLIAGTLDGNTFLTNLLFQLDRKSASGSVSTEWLVPIATALISTPWGSDTNTDQHQHQPIPGVLDDPVSTVPPDIGTSASASATPPPRSTLSLIMPLLRLCCSPSSGIGQAVPTLTARIFSSLQPYPAPPLELAVEASSLLPQLPDIVGQPLRACLSGLMADLTFAQSLDLQNAAQTQQQTTNAVPDTSSETLPPLPSTFPENVSKPRIPLQHVMPLLLSYMQRSSKFAKRKSGDQPWDTHIRLLAIGRFLSNPEDFMLHLVEASITALLGTHQIFTPELEAGYLFAVEGLPRLLKWWKDHSQPKWAYPAQSSVVECLTTALDMSRDGLKSFSAWLDNLHSVRQAQAENEEEGGGFSPLEGWRILSLQETMITRMLELELLDRAAAQVVLPDAQLDTAATGESLMNRLSVANKAALPFLELVIASSRGAQRAFADEVLSLNTKTIRALSQSPSPDNVFVNLSSSSTVLTSLSIAIPPTELLSLLAPHLLDQMIDDNAKADDPQGVFARYGEGVVLVEALADVFGLDLPSLLRRSRRAVAWVHLEETHRTCLSGWVKALFGSEGIDDQILLSTEPKDLCWLAPSIIQQAIAATAMGQLDLDALHSGLSYFSQPLLSWCLCGIIAWLCDEILRNGCVASMTFGIATKLTLSLTSALHLDVLQNLLSGGQFPDAVLRVNRTAISRVLDPASGLVPVFRSSNFDPEVVLTKLRASSVDLPRPSTANGILPLNILRSHIHVLRNLSSTQHQWSAPFLSDLEDCTVREGPSRVVEVIVSELLRPTLGFDRAEGDPLATFASIILALPMAGRPSLVQDLVRIYLPRFLRDGPNPQSSELYALTSLVKSSTLLSAEIDRDGPGPSGYRLLSDTIALLSDASSPMKGNTSHPRKRAKYGSYKSSDAVRSMRTALMADEEVKGIITIQPQPSGI